MNLFAQMMTFILVAEEQNFTRAAEKLSLSTTAVSKQIQQLEEYLDQRLLDRHTRRVKLTEIGERFYAYCKQLQQEMAQLDTFIKSQHIAPQGHLRILSTAFTTPFFLIPHLAPFRQQFPHIQLDIELGERIPDIGKEDYDVLLGFGTVTDSSQSMRQRELTQTKHVLCASPSYLKKLGAPKTPQDLTQYQLITHSLRRPNNLITFKDGSKIFMKPPAIVINSFDALTQLCCDGAGILQTFYMNVEQLIHQGKLIQLLPDIPMKDAPVYMFYHPDKFAKPHVRCFIEFLLDAVK